MQPGSDSVAAAWTLVAFWGFNTLRVLSYLPQIARVARDAHGASAISRTTWTIWIGANASTAAYAAIHLGDRWLTLVSTVNAACCATVLLLAIRQRRRWRRAESLRLQRPDARAHASIGAAGRAR